MAEDIVVSICCWAFNQAGYIRDALDGFLIQATTFPIEIIIHDDASTDGTSDIIREYEKRYPEVIVPIYQTENQYSKGVRISATYVFPRARGKYIALCEGDDYWTDAGKLQKQVDFLESHPECSMCFHPTYLLYQATGDVVIEWQGAQRPYYHAGDVLSMRQYIATCTVLFRSALVRDLPSWYYRCPVGDFPLFALLAEHGELGVIKQFMSVHRVHARSLWQSADEWAREQMNRETLIMLGKHFGPGYEHYVNMPLADSYANQAKLYADLGDTRNAKAYIRRSISTSFRPRRACVDQVVMLGRLYCPGLYRLLKWILKEGRFSPGRMLRRSTRSRLQRMPGASVRKSGSK